MKLQKQLSRKVGAKEYAKWVIVIPPEQVKEAHLRDGDNLKIFVKNRKLIIEKSCPLAPSNLDDKT